MDDIRLRVREEHERSAWERSIARPLGGRPGRDRLASMKIRFQRAGAAWLATCVAIAALQAQGQKRLTLDAIYDPQTRVSFSGAPPQTAWLDEATYLVGRRGAWTRVNVATGDSAPLFDAGTMENALASLRSEERRVGKECRSRWSPY